MSHSLFAMASALALAVTGIAQTWTTVSLPAGPNGIGVDPLNADHLLVQRNDLQVGYETSDGGVSGSNFSNAVAVTF